MAKEIERTPDIPARPIVDVENDMQYFLSPMTGCEHIKIENVDIDADRMDVVEPSKPVENDCENKASTYRKESAELSDHESIVQYANTAYALQLDLHSVLHLLKQYIDLWLSLFLGNCSISSFHFFQVSVVA